MIEIVKFYIKTVASSMLLTFLLLLSLNLVKGIDLSALHRKLLIIPIVIDVFFIVFNEKCTRSERWTWHYYLLLAFIGVMATALVILFL